MVKIGGKWPQSDGSDSSHEIDLEAGGGENGCDLQEVELGSEVVDVKVNVDKVERDCRICHLGLVSGGEKEEGVPIELGCSCKDDLAAAHKHCAEAWFKIKGNKTCEICGSIAKNVVAVLETEAAENLNEASSAAAATATPNEPLRFWQGHRLLNLLLACMVFAFVISWLLRFNVQS